MTIDEVEKIKTVVENKDYIVQLVNTVAKTLVEAFENLTIEDVNMFQLGYSKAIDDFVEKIELKYLGVHPDDLYERYYPREICKQVKELAEQLKAGDRECTEKIKFQRE